MRAFRHWLMGRFFLPVSAGLLMSVGAHAATAPSMPAQRMMDALANANAAVVGIRVTATEDARSADTLGQRRRGSGVLIGQDGLVLTIGHLMLEAEQIEIITQDNKTLPARAVAYDLATGFGLLRPLLPLPGAMAQHTVKLGSAQALQTGEPLMAVTGPQPNDDGDIVMTRLVSNFGRLSCVHFAIGS